MGKSEKITKICQPLQKMFYFFFSHSIRMSGKSENFGHKKTNKSNFYKNEGLFKINDFDLIIY